jgi:hypothetical protein
MSEAKGSTRRASRGMKTGGKDRRAKDVVREPLPRPPTAGVSDDLHATVADLVASLRDHERSMRMVLAELSSLAENVAEVRELAWNSREQLLRRHDELQGVLYELQADGSAPHGALQPWPATEPLRSPRDESYQELVDRVRALSEDLFPRDAIVLVVSKGDNALLNVGRATGWHFPQGAHRKYAGFYPRDSRAAIRHLEQLRKQGATHLLIPATASWWLDYYAGLKAHVDQRYSVLARRPDACLVYSLTTRRRRPRR